MTSQTELLPPNVPAPIKVQPTDSVSDTWTHGLKSKWPTALDLAGSNLPCRLEGEVADLVCNVNQACNNSVDTRVRLSLEKFPNRSTARSIA